MSFQKAVLFLCALYSSNSPFRSKKVRPVAEPTVGATRRSRCVCSACEETIPGRAKKTPATLDSKVKHVFEK